MPEPDPRDQGGAPADPPDDSGGDPNDQGDDLAGLDDHARGLVERANREAARFRREARTSEERATAAEGELAQLRQTQESEQERLVREAEERGMQAGFERAAPLLLDADFAIVASGRMREPADAARLISAETRAELLAMDDAEARRRRASEIVDELIEARPYMAVAANGDQQSGSGRAPLVTQGARSGKPRGDADPDAWLRDRSKR